MKACFRPQEAETYLRMLFGHYPAGWIEFRALRTGDRPQVRSWKLPGCLREGMSEIRLQIGEWVAGGRDVYVGVLPRSAESGRGKADVLSWGALWVDLDRKIVGAELALLDVCQMVVDTGNGWHGYIIGPPKNLGTIADRVAREQLIKQFQRQIHTGVDSTHDLSRILRVAGTVNHKREPKPVVLLRPDVVESVEVPGEVIGARDRLGLDRIAPPPDWTGQDQDEHEKIWTDGWRTDPRIPDLRELDRTKPWPLLGLCVDSEHEWIMRILVRMVARGDRYVDLLDFARSQSLDEAWLERTLDEFRADALR